ncbi:restriction endonuclease subunit S, partial [Prolixibacteraceae bacterium]|nr:restriction endonuclease subunit S [Prolixibacteraceae bacterium]
TSILGGGTPSKQRKEFYTGNVPWVTPKDMKHDFIFGSIDKITDEAVRNSSTKIINRDSILMVIRSGILKRKLPLAMNKVKVCVNQDLKAFIVNVDIVVPLFLLYTLKCEEQFILGKVRAVTADNIEFSQIKNLMVPLPPLLLQQSFADRISKIESQKVLAQKSLSESEDLFQSLMQKAFKGELS